MAPTGGARRRRGRVPGQAGRTAPVVRLGVPVPGYDPNGRCVPAERAGRVPGMAVRAAGLDNRGTGPQGRTNAQIAAQLYISARTVGSHLDRIRDKTGCRRRADLTRLALAAGLV